MQKIVKFKKSFKHYLKLVYARYEAKDYWGVLDAIKNAKSLQKNKREKQKLCVMLAQCYYEMGQFEQSLNQFFKVASCEVLRASAFFGIGRNLVSLRRFDLAFEYFTAAIKWDVLGVFSDACVEWISYIKEIDKPNGEEQMLFLSKRFLSQNNPKAARKILGEMKTNEKTLELLAFCDLCEEDYASAKLKAKECLMENPNSCLAHIVLIKVYEKENKSKRQKEVTNLLALSLNKKEDIKRVAMFLCYEKDFLGAISYFEKLCEIDEFNPTNHLLCGLCYYNIKRDQEALLCVGKSIWLDEENPIYSFFYDAIKTRELGDGCKIGKRLPKQMECAKVENLLELFVSGKLSKEIDKSYNLLNDILWSYDLNDLSLTQKTTQSLIASKNKKAICLVQKLLLSTGPTKKQKYVILKEAIKSELFKNYNFVCSFVYSSFNLKKNELKSFSNNFLDGTSSAIAYAECFYPHLLLLPSIIKKANSHKENVFLKNMSSKVIACFLLKENEQVFFNACNFFGVEAKLVEDIFACSIKNEVSGEN